MNLPKTLRLSTGLRIAAVFLAALLLGSATFTAPGRTDLAYAAPPITVTFIGGPYQGAAGVLVSMPIGVGGALGALSVPKSGGLYEVSYGDGSLANTAPTPACPGTPTSCVLQHTYTAAGFYHVHVVVLDSGSGLTQFADTTVTINGGLSVNFQNTPYVGAPGAPVPMLAIATGAVGPIAFTWSFGDGNQQTTTGTFPTSTSVVEPVYIAPSTNPSGYRVTVSVTDGTNYGFNTTTAVISGASGTATQPFSVSAGGPYTGPAGTALPVQATVSAGPGGVGPTGTLKYTWYFDDGSAPDGPFTVNTDTHTYVAGFYHIKVAVLDSGGTNQTIWAFATATVTGSGGVSVTFTGAPYSGNVGTPIPMSAIVTPATGTPTFLWRFGGGAGGTTSGSYTSYETPEYGSCGTFNVTVTVTVGANSAAAATTATIKNCTIPNVQLTLDPTGLTATAGASDGDPNPQTWTFNWGDGSANTVQVGTTPQTAQHTYAVAGTYTISIAIVDNVTGATGSESGQDTVGTGGGGGGGGGTLTMSVTVGVSGTTVTANATSSDSSTQTYTFSWGDGTGTTVTGTTSASATHTYSSNGTYTVYVQAVDDSTFASGNASTTAAVTGTTTAGTTAGYQNCGGTEIPITTICGATSTAAAGYQLCAGVEIPITSICGSSAYGTYGACGAYSTYSTYGCGAYGSAGLQNCYGAEIPVTSACTNNYGALCGTTYACGTNNYLEGQGTYPFSGASSAYTPGLTGGSGCTNGQPPCAPGETCVPTGGNGVQCRQGLAPTTAIGSVNQTAGNFGTGAGGNPVIGENYGTSPTTGASQPSTTGIPVTYQQGWNLVAGNTAVTLSNVTDGPLSYVASQGTYQSVDPSQMQNGVGYWVYFSTTTTVNIPTTTPTTEASVPLPAGQFVMIADSTSGQVTVGGADVVDVYNAATQTWSQSTTLNPGQAAFAYSAAGATASFTSTGVTTPAGTS